MCAPARRVGEQRTNWISVRQSSIQIAPGRTQRARGQQSAISERRTHAVNARARDAVVATEQNECIRFFERPDEPPGPSAAQMLLRDERRLNQDRQNLLLRVA